MQTLMNEFHEEQRKFEREQQRVKDTAVPPWVGYNEEEKIKAQILELSAVSVCVCALWVCSPLTPPLRTVGMY